MENYKVSKGHMMNFYTEISTNSYKNILPFPLGMIQLVKGEIKVKYPDSLKNLLFRILYL